VSTEEPDEPQPAPRGVAERWAYAGVLLTSAGKMVEVWVTDAGQGDELWYPRKTREIIGGIYTTRVERNGDSTTKIGQPVWTGDRVPDLEVARRWAAQDHAAGCSRSSNAATTTRSRPSCWMRRWSRCWPSPGDAGPASPVTPW
jgi:hypothetical protein